MSIIQRRFLAEWENEMNKPKTNNALRSVAAELLSTRKGPTTVSISMQHSHCEMTEIPNILKGIQARARAAANSNINVFICQKLH